MKKLSTYITLSLMMLIMGTLPAFAAAADDAPPSLTVDFEDSNNDGSSNTSVQPSNNNTHTNTVTPPIIPSPSSNETPPTITFTFDPNQAAATVTTNNNSTNISKTGPATNYLIIASLVLGYFANRRFKKTSYEKSNNQSE